MLVVFSQHKFGAYWNSCCCCCCYCCCFCSIYIGLYPRIFCGFLPFRPFSMYIHFNNSLRFFHIQSQFPTWTSQKHLHIFFVFHPPPGRYMNIVAYQRRSQLLSVKLVDKFLNIYPDFEFIFPERLFGFVRVCVKSRFFPLHVAHAHTQWWRTMVDFWHIQNKVQWQLPL